MARYNTPLRYPGGKQKLTPFVVDVIRHNNMEGCRYVEPYAGGAGVAVELLLDGVVSSIVLNDSSYAVYAFWQSVREQPDELCSMIRGASLTIDEWLRRREIIRNPTQHSQLEVGYSLFFMNRCNRSGVVGGGVIGGLKQDGPWKMDARFSRNELIRRVECIAARAADIELFNGDAEAFVTANLPRFSENTLIYYDPPYINRSAKLYLNDYIVDDHKRIAETIQAQVGTRWMVSYDHDERIAEYYKDREQFTYHLQYNAAKVYKGKELFIFSDDLQIPNETRFAPIDLVINPPRTLFPNM